MSDLVPIRGRDLESGHAIPAALPVPAGVSSLRAWAASLGDAVQLAEALVDTPFVPDSYRPKLDPRASPEQRQAAREVAVATAAAAMMYGSNLGFDPMSSLVNVYVVGGRPGLYAAAMVALVQAAGHEVWTEDVTASRAVVCGRRKGSEFVERVEVTMDAARRAGWTRNAKYQSEPDAMLWARAASKVCRRVAQDVLRGLGSSVEELQDGDDAPAASPPALMVSRAALPSLPGDAEPSASSEVKPKATRAPRKKAAGGPESPRPVGESGPPPLPGEDVDQAPGEVGPEEPPAAAPPLPGEAPATPEQFQAIAAGFRDLDITGPARGQFVERVLGRPVADPTELTAAEAAAVVDALMGPPPDDAPDDDGQQVLEPPEDES